MTKLRVIQNRFNTGSQTRLELSAMGRPLVAVRAVDGCQRGAFVIDLEDLLKALPAATYRANGTTDLSRHDKERLSCLTRELED